MEILEEARSGIVTKWLAGFEDGRAAEFVLIERAEKNIVCFSTMVGCPVGCGFCASGIAGLFGRKLSPGEMLGMADFARASAARPERPWVLSAMGEGEPAANIGSVLSAFAAMKRSEADRLALSTSAPTAALLARTLSALLQYRDAYGYAPKLQYSLHSGDPGERARMFRPGHLAPEAALALVRRSGYPNVEVNVTLIEGWNDGPASLAALSRVLGGHGPWHVKLNRFNGLDGEPLQDAGRAAYRKLEAALLAEGHRTEYYETDGNDIAAACGQLHFRHADAPGMGP